MDEKKMNSIPDKHNEALENVDGVRGIEQSSLIMYDSLIGVKNTSNIFKMAIIFLTICLIFVSLGLGGALIWAVNRNPMVAYTIQVSEITGEARGIGMEEVKNLRVDEKSIKFFLSNFVKKTRTIPKDINDYKKQTQDQLSYLTPASKTKLETLYAEVTDTKEIISARNVTEVVIESFLPIEKNKYQINYSEIVMSESGIKIKQNKYSMLITLGRTVPKKEGFEANPYGLLITDVQLSLLTTVNIQQQNQTGAVQGQIPVQPVQTPANQVPVMQQPQQVQPQQPVQPQDQNMQPVNR